MNIQTIGNNKVRNIGFDTALRQITLGLSILGFAWGCGTSNQLKNGVYRDREAKYQIGTLNGEWQRIHLGDQNDLAWFHKNTNAIIQVNASCDESLDIPLQALANQVLAGFTDRTVKNIEKLPFAQREALRMHVWAKLDGVPREIELQVLKKDQCVYDFALISPPGDSFQRSQSNFRSFVEQFRVL